MESRTYDGSNYCYNCCYLLSISTGVVNVFMYIYGIYICIDLFYLLAVIYIGYFLPICLFSYIYIEKCQSMALSDHTCSESVGAQVLEHGPLELQSRYLLDRFGQC